MPLYVQPDIAEETKRHEKNIADLREKCKAEIALSPLEFDDDLFLLRFCLSHKEDVPARVEACKQTCQWRIKHRALLAKIRAGERHPDLVQLLKYSCSAHHEGKPLLDGSPTFIVRQGVSAMSLVMEKMKPEQIHDAIIFQKEEAFALVDHFELVLDPETGKEVSIDRSKSLSRKKGKIVKMVSFSDMNNFGWANFSRAFMTCLGGAIKQTEFLYPQLLGNSIILHPPSFMKMILGIASVILPKATLEKMRHCSGEVGGDIMKCPVASKVARISDIPTFLGGTCVCAERGGCIEGIPNSFTGLLRGNEKTRAAIEMTMCKVTVSITLKEKEYAFRVRALLNNGPMTPSQCVGSDDINDDFIVAKPKERVVSKTLAVADLGPYLIPFGEDGKPEMAEKEFKDKIVFSLDIQKVDAADSHKVLERKEKRVEVEITPFVAVQGKKVEFGDTADLVVSLTPMKFSPVLSSPATRTAGSPGAFAASPAAASAAASASGYAAAADAKKE